MWEQQRTAGRRQHALHSRSSHPGSAASPASAACHLACWPTAESPRAKRGISDKSSPRDRTLSSSATRKSCASKLNSRSGRGIGRLSRGLYAFEDNSRTSSDCNGRQAGHDECFHNALQNAAKSSAGRGLSGIGYSAGVAAARTSLGDFGWFDPMRACSSWSHSEWCCFAQLTSTVPSPIASNAPSIPIVPI